MNKIIENIATAMRMCDIEQISEGGLYWALFQQGVGADEATLVVKQALDSGVLIRQGVVLSVAHGKRDSRRTWAVCNS